MTLIPSGYFILRGRAVPPWPQQNILGLNKFFCVSFLPDLLRLIDGPSCLWPRPKAGQSVPGWSRYTLASLSLSISPLLLSWVLLASVDKHLGRLNGPGEPSVITPPRLSLNLSESSCSPICLNSLCHLYTNIYLLHYIQMYTFYMSAIVVRTDQPGPYRGALLVDS